MTVIDPRDEVLNFADREVAQALCYSMRKNGARFLLGEKVRMFSVSANCSLLFFFVVGGVCVCVCARGRRYGLAVYKKTKKRPCSAFCLVARCVESKRLIDELGD